MPMREKEFSSDLGATAACTLRIAKGGEQPVSPGMKECVKADAWFGSITCADVLSVHNFKSIMSVRTNCGLFPKAFIEEVLKDAPDGTHIILTGTGPRGTQLMKIGYRYSSKKNLLFIASQDGGSTRTGTSYEMKFTDEFGNVCVRFVDRPEIVSEFFMDSNIIDSFNHMRQFELAMEKKWYTHDGYFRLLTTMEAIGVTQALYLSRHHKLFETYNLCNHQESNDDMAMVKTIQIKKFAGILAKQLFRKGEALAIEERVTNPQPNVGPLPSQITVAVTNNSDLSTLDTSIRGSTEKSKDKNGRSHQMFSLPKKRNERTGKLRRIQRFCQRCRDVDGVSVNSSTICITCNRAFCTLSSFNNNQDCYQAHINNCGCFEKIERAPKRPRTNNYSN